MSTYSLFANQIEKSYISNIRNFIDPTAITIYYTKIGNTVQLFIPEYTVSGTHTVDDILVGLPTEIIPTTTQYTPCIVVGNNVNIASYAQIRSDTPYVYFHYASFTSGQVNGIRALTLNYLLN